MIFRNEGEYWTGECRSQGRLCLVEGNTMLECLTKLVEWIKEIEQCKQ